MVQIAGKYKLESNDKFKEFLVGLGIDGDRAASADAAKSTLEVSLEGDTVKFVTTDSDKTYSSTLTVGKEVDEPTLHGRILKSTTTLDGNIITINSKAADGITNKREYTFSDSGVILKLTSSKTGLPQASRTYKRI